VARGLHLGRTKDGYLYQIQLQLTRDAVSASFTVFYNNALGLKITGVDIDGDEDIDLRISDQFSGQHVGIWLNDGKGHFFKSPPGLFSAKSNADFAFVPADPKSVGQRTCPRERRRLPDNLAATGYIQPLSLERSTLNRRPAERTIHFAVDPLQPRPPPAASAI
jgi:hypothetical protein